MKIVLEQDGNGNTTQISSESEIHISSLFDEIFNYRKILNNNIEHQSCFHKEYYLWSAKTACTRDGTCRQSSTPVTCLKHRAPCYRNNDKPLNKTFSHLVAINPFTTEFCSNFDG